MFLGKAIQIKRAKMKRFDLKHCDVTKNNNNQEDVFKKGKMVSYSTLYSRLYLNVDFCCLWFPVGL